MAKKIWDEETPQKTDEDNYNDACEAYKELFVKKVNLVKKNNALKGKLRFMNDGTDKDKLIEQIKNNDLESERITKEEIEPTAEKRKHLKQNLNQ